MDPYFEAVAARLDDDEVIYQGDLRRVVRWSTAVVQRYLRAAVYEVNNDGTPKRKHQRDAVVEAIAVQARNLIENELTADVLSGGATAEPEVTSTSDNGASLSFDHSAANQARSMLRFGALTLEARMILDAAGLGPQHPGIVF